MITQLKTANISNVLPITNQWTSVDLSTLSLLQKVVLVQQINDYITHVGDNNEVSVIKKELVLSYLLNSQ